MHVGSAGSLLIPEFATAHKSSCSSQLREQGMSAESWHQSHNFRWGPNAKVSVSELFELLCFEIFNWHQNPHKIGFVRYVRHLFRKESRRWDSIFFSRQDWPWVDVRSAKTSHSGRIKPQNGFMWMKQTDLTWFDPLIRRKIFVAVVLAITSCHLPFKGHCSSTCLTRFEILHIQILQLVVAKAKQRNQNQNHLDLFVDFQNRIRLHWRVCNWVGHRSTSSYKELLEEGTKRKCRFTSKLALGRCKITAQEQTEESSE